MPAREPTNRQRPDGKTLRARLWSGSRDATPQPDDPAYVSAAVIAADEAASHAKWRRINTRPLARCSDCGVTVNRVDIRKRCPDLTLWREVGEALLPCRSCGGRMIRA